MPTATKSNSKQTCRARSSRGKQRLASPKANSIFAAAFHTFHRRLSGTDNAALVIAERQQLTFPARASLCEACMSSFHTNSLRALLLAYYGLASRRHEPEVSTGFRQNKHFRHPCHGLCFPLVGVAVSLSLGCASTSHNQQLPVFCASS